MFCKTARGLKSALIITATLIAPVLSSSSAAIAETQEAVQNKDSDAVVAAKSFLQAVSFQSIMESTFVTMADRMKSATAADPALRNTPIDVRQLALDLCHQRVDDLMTDIAKSYAARLTADELRESTAFYGSKTGTLYADFNRQQLANPTTRESASAEFARRFSADQRTAIVRFMTSAVGQKLAHLQPELKKETGEIAREWGFKIGLDIEHAIRSGQSATLSRAKWLVTRPPSGTNYKSTLAL